MNRLRDYLVVSLFGIFAIVILLGVVIQPISLSRAKSALLSHNIHIVPTKKGLASVKVEDTADESMGSASKAGDRMNHQMNLLSSSEK